MQCCNWFIASAMHWQKCNVKTTWPEVPSTINASRIIRDNSWDVKTFQMRIYQLNILNSSILCHRSWFHWYISWMPSFKSIVLGDIGSLCERLHFHHFTQAPAKIAECVDLTYLYLVKSGGDVNCCNCINSLSLPIHNIQYNNLTGSKFTLAPDGIN